MGGVFHTFHSGVSLRRSPKLEATSSPTGVDPFHGQDLDATSTIDTP